MRQSSLVSPREPRSSFCFTNLGLSDLLGISLILMHTIQVNNFQKVPFVYTFIRWFEQKKGTFWKLISCIEIDNLLSTSKYFNHSSNDNTALQFNCKTFQLSVQETSPYFFFAYLFCLLCSLPCFASFFASLCCLLVVHILRALCFCFLLLIPCFAYLVLFPFLIIACIKKLVGRYPQIQ